MAGSCAGVLHAPAALPRRLVNGKILRHGFENYNPFDEKKTTNRCLLEKECGHLIWSINFAKENGDITGHGVNHGNLSKELKVGRYLHHNTVPKRDDFTYPPDTKRN